MTLKEELPALLWNFLLIVSVTAAVFIVPVLPGRWDEIFFRIVYTIMYVSAIFSLEHRGRALLGLFILTVLTEWLSGLFELEWLSSISRGVNVIFFLVIVFYLIAQVAMASRVTVRVIIGSIAGYLLLGVVFAIFVSFVMQHDPAAFTSAVTAKPDSGDYFDSSRSIYFSFVTMATLGYGDIVPLKPYSRSLSMFIAVAGQFYMAVIVALLVGKFASANNNKRDNE